MNSFMEGLSLTTQSRQTAVLRCDGQEIHWNIFAFDRRGRQDPDDDGAVFNVFEQINDYWKTLAITVQKQIFDAYGRIAQLFEQNPADLDWQLRAAVAELLNAHDLADMKYWIDYKANIVIPVDLFDIYVDSPENAGTRNRTYLKEDYKKLLVLSVILRAMVPVWGEYILRTGKEKGTTYKEFYAVRLLASSQLFQSEPMEKLRIFVQDTLPTDKPKDSATIMAFSEDDFSEWMTSLVLVRRISIGDIRGISPKSHLIKNIFQFIRHKFGTHENSFIGKVKSKEVEGSSQEDQSNLSKLESYKMREANPAGDIAIITHSVRDWKTVIAKICPAVPAQMVVESIASVQHLEATILIPEQIALLQYVIKPMLSPISVMFLNKVNMIRNIGVVQAVLWHSGYYEMAALVGAEVIRNDEMMSLGSTGSRARITKEQALELEQIYPYPRRPYGKQKQVKIQNAGIIAIEQLFDAFTENDWKLSIPEHWIDHSKLIMKPRRYSTPNDIRVKIAELVIAVGKYEYPFIR